MVSTCGHPFASVTWWHCHRWTILNSQGWQCSHCRNSFDILSHFMQTHDFSGLWERRDLKSGVQMRCSVPHWDFLDYKRLADVLREMSHTGKHWGSVCAGWDSVKSPCSQVLDVHFPSAAHCKHKALDSESTLPFLLQLQLEAIIGEMKCVCKSCPCLSISNSFRVTDWPEAY